MNNLLEGTYPYKGYDIEIYYDDSAESPDVWCVDDVFIVYDHRSFCVKREGFDPQDIWDSLQDKRKTYKGYWVFPLYAYIHSGVHLSLGHNGDRWDTSMSGFVLVQRQKKWTWKIDEAEKVAQSMVKEWNMYLSGDVYRYETQFDSCSGFYGSEGMEEAMCEAKDSIDRHIEWTRNQHFNRLKSWIKSGVNIIYRQPLTI